MLVNRHNIKTSVHGQKKLRLIFYNDIPTRLFIDMSLLRVIKEENQDF